MSAASKKRKIGYVDLTPSPSDMTMGSMAGSFSSNSLLPSQHVNTPTRHPLSSHNPSLELVDGGVERSRLNSDAAPPVADYLVQSLAEIGMGMGIMPFEMMDTMTKDLQRENQNLRLWTLAWREREDKYPGHVPSWEELATARERAARCFDELHDEASWNMEVYYKAL